MICSVPRGLFRLALFALGLTAGYPTLAADAPPTTRSHEAIAYYPAATRVEDPGQRCVLDLRHPLRQPGFATLIWFHGGGLTSGQRKFPPFQGEGVALVAAGYRLAPQVNCPDFLTDAAAATAWVVKNIASYGGDPRKVFVGGHSAGGYLAAMIGMDPKWLAAHGVSNRSLAGLIPVSAQVSTHFHVKQLRGIPGPALRPVIDEFAPLHFASRDLPPICLVLGDRRIEYPCRVEENEWLSASLRHLGHPDVEFHEIKNLNHGTVVKGAASVMPKFIARVSKTQ